MYNVSVLDSERKYIEYAHSLGNAWDLVESRILRYAFARFYRSVFNGRSSDQVLVTKSGTRIVRDFRVLDLGAGTGRASKLLIKEGVPSENVVAVDLNENYLYDSHFPDGTDRRVGDVREIGKILERNERFDFVVANMLMHLLSYEEGMDTLRQLEGHLRRYTSRVLMVVPHPINVEPGFESISRYHRLSSMEQKAPWGEKITVHNRTILDYRRGLFEAGHDPSFMFSSWVGSGRPDNGDLLEDSAVWRVIRDGKVSVDLGYHYFRLWTWGQ